MNQLHLKQEAVRCLLCENAPCTAACPQGDPARAVRAVRFDNQVLGARLFAACSEAESSALVCIASAFSPISSATFFAAS